MLPTPLHAAPLRLKDTPAATALLAQNPSTNIFLLDRLEQRGCRPSSADEWYGAWLGQDLVAVAVLVGRAAHGSSARIGVVAGSSAGCEAIGVQAQSRGGVDMLTGPRAPCDALWTGLGAGVPRRQIDQLQYLTQNPSPGFCLPLRNATSHDFPLVCAWAAEQAREDLGLDPRQEDAQRHHRVVRARIEEGRVLLGLRDRSPCFLLEVGTCRVEGVQVGGTYVPPSLRGQGIATAGMRSAAHHLLTKSQTISLHVHAMNTSAIHCYVRAGFTPGIPLRLLIR